jgi:HlyD family secretion protein
MRNKIIFALSIMGILAGLISAYVLSVQRPAQPPVFTPVTSPYQTAIYANGMIESEQQAGENINIYPEVTGAVTKILAHEGQKVAAGTPLLTIDDTVQRATTEQLRLQSEAAQVALQELKAQPRKETLAVNKAQVEQAKANLTAARDQYEKRRAAYEIDKRSISKDVVDTAKDAVAQAEAALEVAVKQYDLTKAGAWIYDINNQQKQYEALTQAYASANALLAKFTIKAQIDGVVLSINTAPGSYVSPAGAYDTYTQGSNPLVVMSTSQAYLAVRCFIDEILVSRLPAADHIRAEMSIRGTDKKVPLEFVRVQPYVSPKIELSNQRAEKVDLRVLPVIFRFPKKGLDMVYPGQQVDVYIGPK